MRGKITYFLGLGLISGSGVGGSGVPFCSVLSLPAATSNGSSVVIARDFVGRCFFLGPRTRDLVMEVRAAVSSITVKSMEVASPLVRGAPASTSCGSFVYVWDIHVILSENMEFDICY